MALNIFVSYAREDETFRRELDTHLEPLRHDGKIEPWSDNQLRGGERWEDVIADRLKRAHVILLLVSPSYLASKYCYLNELPMALARERSGAAKVVPIVIRACHWEDAPFHRLHALPSELKTVADHRWSSRDAAWTSVMKDLRRTFEEAQPNERSDARHRNRAIFALGFVLVALIVSVIALASGGLPSSEQGAPVPPSSPLSRACWAGVDCTASPEFCASGRKVVYGDRSVGLPAPNQYDLRVAGALGATLGDQICVRLAGDRTFACTPFELTADYTMPSAPAYAPGLVRVTIDLLVRRGLDIEIRGLSGAVKNSATNYRIDTDVKPTALCQGLKVNLAGNQWVTFYMEDPPPNR